MARKKETTPAERLGLPADYPEFLESLKSCVRQARTKAMLSVNCELIALYWDIGRRIVDSRNMRTEAKASSIGSTAPCESIAATARTRSSISHARRPNRPEPIGRQNGVGQNGGRRMLTRVKGTLSWWAKNCAIEGR